MKKHIFTICFSAALLAFTVYICLDTFVITAVYNDNAAEMNTSMFDNTTEKETEDNSETDATAAEPVQSESENTENTKETTAVPYCDDNTYSDENITVSVSTYEKYGTTIYVADITLSSAEYLKTAFANDTYGKNVTAVTSSIAQAHNAIIAVNGDYYGSQEKGYVIRNGIVYRSTSKGSDVICIFADGTVKVVSDRDYTAEELVSMGVWQAFTFGPALIEDGNISVDENDEVGKAKASNPRTAIGLIDANHFVFVVSDGRTDESEGLSLYELAEFMQSIGVATAYNLDGGGSSTMVFNGELINNPTTNGKIKERAVSDIVYIGY